MVHAMEPGQSTGRLNQGQRGTGARPVRKHLGGSGRALGAGRRFPSRTDKGKHVGLQGGAEVDMVDLIPQRQKLLP